MLPWKHPCMQNGRRVERCLGLVGTFLVDVKHTDGEKFKRYTGGNLDLVNTNLKQAC